MYVNDLAENTNALGCGVDVDGEQLNLSYCMQMMSFSLRQMKTLYSVCLTRLMTGAISGDF